MTLRQFHNALRILLNIESFQLYEALGRKDAIAWRSFTDNPFRWFITASDADADAVWKLIEMRQGGVSAEERFASDLAAWVKNDAQRHHYDPSSVLSQKVNIVFDFDANDKEAWARRLEHAGVTMRNLAGVRTQ